MNKNPITVQTVVKAPLAKVWSCWNEPEHISGWSFASDDWEAINKSNDLQVGGSFTTRMQAKDKSAGFDFTGTYTVVKEPELLEYDLEDGRHVKIEFISSPEGVQVIESFDPESQNSRELQQSGWQAFLDNFKKYTEGV